MPSNVTKQWKFSIKKKPDWFLILLALIMFLKASLLSIIGAWTWLAIFWLSRGTVIPFLIFGWYVFTPCFINLEAIAPLFRAANPSQVLFDLILSNILILSVMHLASHKTFTRLCFVMCASWHKCLVINGKQCLTHKTELPQYPDYKMLVYIRCSSQNLRQKWKIPLIWHCWL